MLDNFDRFARSGIVSFVLISVWAFGVGWVTWRCFGPGPSPDIPGTGGTVGAYTVYIGLNAWAGKLWRDWKKSGGDSVG